MSGKALIATNLDLRVSRFVIHVLSKHAPGNGLRNNDIGGNNGRKLLGENPSRFRVNQTPLPPAVPGNLNQDRTTHRRTHVTESVWQAAHKGLQHRMIKSRNHNPGTTGG